MGEVTIGRNHAGPVRGHAQVRAVRRRGFTAAKRQAFLEQLAMTSNVKASAKAAGLGVATVYRVKKQDPGFAADWGDALCEAFEALEIVLLDRAMHGTERPVFHAGKKIAVTREFNDAVALKLLEAHRAERAAVRAAREHAGDGRAVLTIEEVKEKLADMRTRQAALEADEAV
jgi:hypothetical protein